MSAGSGGKSGGTDSDLADGHIVFLLSKQDPPVTFELETRLESDDDAEPGVICFFDEASEALDG